jgi:outer membrane protein assembly factor BamB
VYDGVAYVLGQEFYAIDASSGRELWSYPINTSADFKAAVDTKWHFWSEWASPAVYGDLVIITSSLDNKIIALDRTPGDGRDEGIPDPKLSSYDVIWVHQLDDYNIFGSRSSPLIINDVIFVGTAEGDLVALERDFGENYFNYYPKVNWKYHIGTRVDSSPAYYNYKIYIGTWDIHNRPPTYEFDVNDTYFTVLDATPGDGKDEGMADPDGAAYDVIWRKQLGDLIWGAPTIDGTTGTVYIGCTDKKMYALDAQTGSEKWNFTANGPIYSSPALADGKLFFGTVEPGNSLYAIEADSGKFIWRYQGDEKVAAPPIVVGDAVISPVMSGRVNALHTDGNNDGTTSLLWALELPDRVRASPVIANGRLYLSCWDSNLYCMGRYPGIDLVVSGFFVEGDSREATLEFSIINLADGEISNSTLFIYDGRVLIHNETLGPFPPRGKYFIRHTILEPEPGDHYYKIRLNYTDGQGNEHVFRYNRTGTIEKYTIPSFVPAPGAGMVIAAFIAAMMVIDVQQRRRDTRHE